MEMKEFLTEVDARAWMFDEVDDPCVDNYRFAFINDGEAMTKYKAAEDNGCCGSFDREVIVGGHAAMIGCNFGH